MQSILHAVSRNKFGSINDIHRDLIQTALLAKGDEQEQLFGLARRKRTENFPHEKAEFRSVVEISNICRQKCKYCGMSYHSKRKRYTISHKELMDVVENIYYKGRKVLLLQSGENNSQRFIDLVCKCLEDIKYKFGDLTVILCMGNLSYHQYKLLRDSGADRYILKFETSNPDLYKQLKPGDSLQSRLEGLHHLIELGFDVGTGNIVGLPGQTIQDIINDLLFFAGFRLSMISSTVFIPGKDSHLRDMPMGDLDLTLNFMALVRIMYPEVLIPATSSLEKAGEGGQYRGLLAGANAVTVHDGTPERLKEHFPIYSADRFTPNETHIDGIVKRAGLNFPGKLHSNAQH